MQLPVGFWLMALLVASYRQLWLLVRAGDKIILPRNIHQSAIAGLIITGAIPVFINPEYDTSQ